MSQAQAMYRNSGVQSTDTALSARVSSPTKNGTMSALHVLPPASSRAADLISLTPLNVRQSQINNTSISFFKPSGGQSRGPERISAYAKIPSACIPGGLSLNSPVNDPHENALFRENNRVAGFGPGMAGTLIGNSSRRGQSLTVNEVKDNRTALASIGWGVSN